jgi:hypothetical protein
MAKAMRTLCGRQVRAWVRWVLGAGPEEDLAEQEAIGAALKFHGVPRVPYATGATQPLAQTAASHAASRSTALARFVPSVTWNH